VARFVGILLEETPVAQTPKALVWKTADRLGEGIISDTSLVQLGVAPVCLAPGEESEGHSHAGVEELNIFRSGSGLIQIENDVIEVCGGTVAVIPAGCFHEVRNTGSDHLEYVAVFDADIYRPDVVLKSKESHFDPSVPSYFRMLNAIAAGEAAGARAFERWIELTSSPELSRVLRVIAIRSAEHATAFEKRLLELGRTPDLSAVDPFAISLLAFLASEASDREKLERLQVLAANDPFAAIFADLAIDPTTGALLGRYIAEKRDSGRMLLQCHAALAGPSVPRPDGEQAPTADAASGAELRALREELGALTALVCELRDALGRPDAASQAHGSAQGS
jgi:quercetin dioxygenase-like cupin family protein